MRDPSRSASRDADAGPGPGTGAPEPASDAPSGTIFDIDTFAVHDGPGIRMAVYFKGCPLRCAWCHSPESQSASFELVYVADRCTRCGACASACPTGVHTVESGEHTVDRSRCTACGLCARVCPTGALELKGRIVSAEEVVRRATRMRPFFEATGGGVTLTGGEVTMQPRFAVAVLEGLNRAGIHTVVETAGHCSPETLDAIADLADVVYFDLKLADEEAHRRWAGVQNRRILANASRRDPDRTVVRVPLIPGITDTDGNIAGVSRAAEAVGLRRIQFLRFNQSAGAKYEWLGRPFSISANAQSDERYHEILRIAAEAAPGLSIEREG